MGPFFGDWASGSFTVGAADVALKAPGDTAPYAGSVDLTFALPDGSDYVVVDVYWPNGGYDLLDRG